MMRKLNNKGFTLVEVIAVVVILAILAILLVPNVSSLLNRGGNEAYDNLKKSILVAAKEYVNDNRYSETKIETVCVETLVVNGYLSSSGVNEDGTGYIVDPRNRNKRLNLTQSCVTVTFDSEKKDYSFSLSDDDLKWEWKRLKIILVFF